MLYGVLICQLLLNRVNRNFLSAFAHFLKSNSTVDKSKECVVLADTYVVAWMNVCSSLAIENVACENELTVCSLSAKSFGLGISAVLGGTHTFFMSKKLNI